MSVNGILGIPAIECYFRVESFVGTRRIVGLMPIELTQIADCHRSGCHESIASIDINLIKARFKNKPQGDCPSFV